MTPLNNTLLVKGFRKNQGLVPPKKNIPILKAHLCPPSKKNISFPRDRPTKGSFFQNQKNKPKARVLLFSGAVGMDAKHRSSECEQSDASLQPKPESAGPASLCCFGGAGLRRQLVVDFEVGWWMTLRISVLATKWGESWLHEAILEGKGWCHDFYRWSVVSGSEVFGWTGKSSHAGSCWWLETRFFWRVFWEKTRWHSKHMDKQRSWSRSVQTWWQKLGASWELS